MFASSKTVLLIGDEALYIYSVSFKSTQLIETVPWEAENFEANVAKILAKDCGGKPVMIINDMVEQHYRKERVPKVSVMDRQNVVKRKLNVAFPNYPARAALPLKDKIPKSEKGPAASIYIFAAAPNSEAFNKAMTAAKLSYASISGFGLLPVEVADMVKTLSAKLTPKGEPKPRWTVFIGQHHNGALRQVVTKNGELALTRMTPIVPSDDDPQQWASEVNQEFQATMSYMSRFGFTPQDGLDVIIIANPEVSSVVDDAIEVMGAVHILSASEAAKKLGITLSRQVDQRYADGIHAAWIGRKAKLTLPMQSREMESFSKPRQMAGLATAALVLGGMFLGYTAFNEYSALNALYTEADDVRARQAQLDVQYQAEVQRKEALGFDVRLVQSSITVYGLMEKEDIKPLKLFKGIGTALGRDLRLDNVTLHRDKDDYFEAQAAAAKIGIIATPPPEGEKNHVYEALLQLTFPSTTDIEKGNKEVDELKARLQKELPDHEVVVQKYLKDTQYVDELVVDEKKTEAEDLVQDFIVSISIKGANS